MKIKCGRDEYDLLPKDTIMDNGACVLILGRVNLNGSTLRISKATFKKMLKEDRLQLIKEENKWVVGGVRYYKLKE